MGNNFSKTRLRVEDLSEIMNNHNNDLESRKDALDQIDDIILKRSLTQYELSKIIYNFVSSYINSKDFDFNRAIVCSTHALLVNNRISDDDILIIKYFLLSSAANPDQTIKKWSIRSIGDFLRKKINQMDELSSKEITEILCKNADNVDEVIRNNSIWNLNIIIEAKKVPLDMERQVIDLCIDKYQDIDNDVRKKALGGLSLLVESFKLETSDILSSMSIFIEGSKGPDEIIKSSSLLGIAKLARKNLIPEDKIADIIEISKSHSRNSCNDARCNATSTLVSLSQHNRIPEDKRNFTRVIFNLCLKDSYTYVRQNGMLGLLAINKEFKEVNAKKRKHELMFFKIQSPLEGSILATYTAPQALDDLAIELDIIRQKLRNHIHYAGTYNEISQREEIFSELGKTTLAESEKELREFRKKIKNLKETANGDNLSIICDPDYFYIEEIAEYMSVYFSTQQGRGIDKDKRDLIYYYQAYFIYERNEEGISKDNLDELMNLYEYCKDPECNIEILKIISKLLTKEARFYLSEEYENKLQKYSNSLEWNPDILDIVIANFRQRFVNEHMQEREHQISRDARYAIDIDKDDVPSICSNKIIAIPDILEKTQVKKITQTKEIPISYRKLAKFRPHIISPGSIMFGVNLEIIEQKGLVYEYNSFLRLELVESGFLDSSFNVNLDIGENTVNRKALAIRTIKLTKDFFQKNNIDQEIIDEEIFKKSLNDNFDKITKNRKNSSNLMKGFVLKEVVSLLFVIEKTDPIASVDSKLNTCLLEKKSHQEVCKMLKRLTETVIMISDSFPLPGQVSVSGHNKAWKISGELLSKLEKGESLIIPTGTPIKPDARESSHFFYVLLKHIKEDPNKVKLVIVNGGDNIASAINIDKNFSQEDVSSAGNYLLCRETRPIDLTKKEEREFLEHYIYKALVLPYTPIVKDKGNDMNNKNLLENINLVSPSFKGKNYTDLSYKPEVLPENERSYSVPSQLFGNCTIFNLQYSLKFIFDWNESKLTHFIHDSLVRYNAFLNQEVDMTYANHNKKESSSLQGGGSIVTEEHQVQEERILAYKERVLIERSEQRTRANSI